MNSARSGHLDSFRLHDDAEYSRRLDEMVKREMHADTERTPAAWGSRGGQWRRLTQAERRSPRTDRGANQGVSEAAVTRMLRLRREEGLTYAQLAERFGLTDGAVQRRLAPLEKAAGPIAIGI